MSGTFASLNKGGGAAACPAPMTRAALLALRASNSLRPECPYIITDHVQNRLVAGTTITLRAVSANELSEQVEVNTTYDNEAWAGIYDIDRALVLELTDNRGNVAKGFSGVEVANFDWGNAAYTNVRVDQSTLTVTYGAGAPIANVEVLSGSSLNLTGFTGSLTHARIHTVAIVNFTNANGTWRYSEWKNSCNFNATGYTGGGDSYYNEFDSCSVNLTGQTGAVYFRNSELSQGSYTISGANAFGIGSCNFQGQSVSRPATGGAVTLTQCSSRATGTIANVGTGALNMTGTQNDGTVSAPGTGATTANYCTLGQSAVITNSGAGALTATRATLVGGSANITADAGSNAAINVTDCEVYSSGTIRIVGAVAGGALNVSATRVESTSFIYKRHTGALNVTQSMLTGSSGIDAQSGNRSYTVTRLSMSDMARATFTGTGAVTDNIADWHIHSRGQVSISCSGPANSILYGEVAGLSGSLTFSGTTGSQNVRLLKCDDGSISFANCTGNTAAAICSARGAGNITFSGITTARDYSYLDCSNLGTIVLNQATGAGSVSVVNVSARGTYTHSGTAGAADRITVTQGALAHNGGNLLYCTKTLAGTLRTGNFNHRNIVHSINTSRTLTAANNDRAEYIGLAPAAYTGTGILI